MQNAYVIAWHDEPDNQNICYRKSFKTREQAMNYAVKNKLIEFKLIIKKKKGS